jgi:N-acetylmuramoyl-L-alanine amidase
MARLINQELWADAGHHLADPGASYNGRTEFEEMRCFRTLVAEEYKRIGGEVYSDDDSETNSQFQKRMKTDRGSVVVSFHLNASVNPEANGSECIISDNALANSKALAVELLDATCEILGTRKRRILKESETPRKKLGILNKPGMAVLVEVCFLSNKTDMDKFDKNKVALARTYAMIIKRYDDLIKL